MGLCRYQDVAWRDDDERGRIIFLDRFLCYQRSERFETTHREDEQPPKRACRDETVIVEEPSAVTEFLKVLGTPRIEEIHCCS